MSMGKLRKWETIWILSLLLICILEYGGDENLACESERPEEVDARNATTAGE